MNQRVKGWQWVENSDQNINMKQSNIDYKNTYYFQNGNSITPSDHPSIDHDPEISTIIKPNPYKANVEIEKDEVVLKPDMSALHKASGKKHSQGGTPVYLDENSFVFSDDKGLAFDKKDHDLFELKQGGKVKQNTPAKVLERNVDIKHYNKMVSIMSDPTKDKLAKDTAASMLEKYLKTVGNVAFLQEQKKNFPTGVPQFAEGTAPVYDTDLKNEIMEQKQYMKYGGKVDNPYMPKMAMAGYVPDPIDPYRSSRTVAGRTTPTKLSNFYDRGTDYLKQWESVIPGISKLGNKDAQSAIYDYTLKTPDGANRISDMWHKYGLTNEGRKYQDLVGMTKNGVFDPNSQLGTDQLTNLKKAYTDGMFGARQLDYVAPPAPKEPEKEPLPNINPGQVSGNPQNGVPVDWQFTPWQRMSHLYSGMKWAGVDREMPYRSHFNATYMDPALVNPEQAVGDMKGAAYHMMEGQDLNSPILANAQKAAAYGDLLDKIPGVRSQYDNQNVGILNSTRAQNNQIRNNESMTNMQNDQQYWRDAATGRSNFKNMRSFMGDQYMNNVMQDVQDNQSLAYNMLTLGPKPAYGFDWKSGNFNRNDKNIMDVQNNTSAGAIDAMTKEAEDMYKAGMPSDVISALVRSKAFSTMAPYLNAYPGMGQVMGQQMMNPYGQRFSSPIGQGRGYKKGGKVKVNPYK